MESFGEYLKALRLETGMTLEQISEQTKIALTNLELLERDRYDLLPPRVFVKGFVKAYAQELGINQDQAIERFEEFTSHGEVPNYEEEEHPLFKEHRPRSSFFDSSLFNIGLTVAGLLSLAILILTGVTRLVDSGKNTDTRQAIAAPVQPSAYGEPMTGPGGETPSSSDFSEPAPREAGKRFLEIKSVGHAWVRVAPDRGPAQEFSMAPGEVQVLKANESFQIQTGNAGAIRLRFDGRVLSELGRENQTLSLSLP